MCIRDSDDSFIRLTKRSNQGKFTYNDVKITYEETYNYYILVTIDVKYQIYEQSRVVDNLSPFIERDSEEEKQQATEQMAVLLGLWTGHDEVYGDAMETHTVTINVPFDPEHAAIRKPEYRAEYLDRKIDEAKKESELNKAQRSARAPSNVINDTILEIMERFYVEGNIEGTIDKELKNIPAELHDYIMAEVYRRLQESDDD